MSKKSVTKWETEYNKYNNGEYDQEYEELRLKFERKPEYIPQYNVMFNENNIQDGKEQYEKYKKMKRIKENISKVKNILEFRDRLEKQINEIDDALKSKDTTYMEKLEQKCDKLDKELKELQNTQDSINLKLKNKDLSDKKRDDLLSQLSSLDSKIEANSLEFSETKKRIDDSYKKANSNSKSKFDRLSVEELNSLKLDLCTKRSKCNMACKYMMQGKSWNAIEVKLDSWDKSRYTAEHSNPVARRLATSRIKSPINRAKEDLEQRKAELKRRREEHIRKCNALNTTQDTKWYQFVQRFKNWRTKNSVTKELEDEEEALIEEQEAIKEAEKIIKQKEEILKDSKTTVKDDDFKSYLKAIAEKGIDSINREKIAKMKKEAADRYADKYGKDQDGNIIPSRYNKQDEVNR